MLLISQVISYETGAGMGGYGSGRRRERVTVDDVPQVRLGQALACEVGGGLLLSWGGWAPGRAVLARLADGSGVVLAVGAQPVADGAAYSIGADAPVVRLESVACRLGGRRYWFLCPRCGRRCGAVFLGGPIACRTCRGLAYRSTGECRRDRALRRLRGLRAQVGAEGGPLSPLIRPRGMHWRRWARFRGRYEAVRHEALRLACLRDGAAIKRMGYLLGRSDVVAEGRNLQGIAGTSGDVPTAT